MGSSKTHPSALPQPAATDPDEDSEPLSAEEDSSLPLESLSEVEESATEDELSPPDPLF